MKSCFKCRERKPLSDFYRHPMMSDGHLGKCKDCARRDARANRMKRLEYYRAYDRARGNRQEVNTWRTDDPRRGKAHNAVAKALRANKLHRKQCESCGQSKFIHAHHDDYNKPLDVRWLCAACHRAHHVNQAVEETP